MDLIALALPLAWLTLVGAPVLTFVVRFRSKNPVGLSLRAGIVIALVALAWILSVELAWRPLNWVALAAAYLAWATIVGSAFMILPRWLGAILGVLGIASFIPGILLGTIGLIGLVFIVGDYAGPPVRSTTLASGLDCVVTNWGSAVSDSGHEVHLYRYLPWFPVLRHQVRHVIVDETNPWNGVPASTGCEEVTAKSAEP